MIQETLSHMGLTKGEIQIYCSLLEVGPASTGIITKHAHVSSSKTYEVLERLMHKGLVSYIVKNGTKYFDATPPERLIDFLEEKKDTLTYTQKEIKKIIPEIAARKQNKEVNNTIVYTGNYGPKIVLKEILDAGKKGHDNFGYGTDKDPYVTHFPYALNNFIKQSRKYTFKTRLLFAKGFTSPNKKALVRYLNKAYLPPVRTMMYGNKVAIVDFTKPFTTIIIHKKEIADAYKKQFMLLWKTADK